MKKTKSKPKTATKKKSGGDCPSAPCSGFTSEELKEFRTLVEMGESPRQVDRIQSRLQMPNFIERVGREKCDAMFVVLKAEYK
jgi:hypothetical protein